MKILSDIWKTIVLLWKAFFPAENMYDREWREYKEGKLAFWNRLSSLDGKPKLNTDKEKEDE